MRNYAISIAVGFAISKNKLLKLFGDSDGNYIPPGGRKPVDLCNFLNNLCKKLNARYWEMESEEGDHIIIGPKFNIRRSPRTDKLVEPGVSYNTITGLKPSLNTLSKKLTKIGLKVGKPIIEAALLY